MAYTIVKSDGTVLTTIADGTINTTSTSLGLPGRNYAGYGNSLDTNFVHITENFADTTPPPNPLKGQLWFDTSTTPGIMKICPTQYESNAANWITLASSGSNTTFGNLTVTGNLSANNITAVNNSNANAISTNFLTVNTSATITTITTGANTTAGNITGNWTLTPGSSLQATNADFLDGYNSSSSATAATIVLRTGDGSIVANLLYGTIATNAQPNITSVGTLSSLGVSGNITAANITANTGVFTGNAAGLTNIPGANVSGQVGNALVAGTVYTNAQPNITSVGTLTSLAVTGNVTAGNVALNGGLTSNRSNVAVSGTTAIDQFAPGTFRTAKYIISASGDDGFQSVETLLVHDGVNAYITIYGSICSNVSGDIIELSANIADSNVKVYATTTDTNVKVNLVASYIQI
jgi:hypothetical protein